MRPNSLFVTLLLAVPAFAQNPATPQSHPPIETSLSLGIAAQLTASRVEPIPFYASATQGFDPSASVLGSLRQSFKPWLGYSVNVGYTRSSENNSNVQGFMPPANFLIPVNIYETSLAYHVQHHVSARLSGSADLGAGVLSFLPVHRGADARLFVPGQYASLTPSFIARPLGVASFGVDYRVTPQLALRAEYRGLLYKFPDFAQRVGRDVTESSQPTVSLTYSFHHKRP